MPASAALPRSSRSLSEALSAAGPLLMFSLRLWASVCLALLVAFSLDLDNPYWAGASAAIVCQPQLGAALRKGWFRMIATVTGAIFIVALTAWFPQDRIAYLGLLSLWAGLCAFAATALRNYASYGASLAGYTAAIIAANNLGATGGGSPDVFLVAVWRASEICIGIACAGIVLAATDLGGARQRLATSFAGLAAEIAARFIRMLEVAGPRAPDTQSERRELLRRVIALEPTVDQALGESSHVRAHAITLEAAVHGLLRALDGWRGVAAHLSRRAYQGNVQAKTILRRIRLDLTSALEPGTPRRWLDDPVALRRACARMTQTLLALRADTPSLRMLADETAKMLAGCADALGGLALLVDAPNRPLRGHRGFRPGVPDWLPPILNGVRAFFAIGGVALFWVVTAWPNGGSAIFFAMAVILLLSPRGDIANGGAIAVGLGASMSIICTAITKFALLPAFETFPALCVCLGLFLVPAAYAMARSRTPAAGAIFMTISLTYLPLLAPANEMTYDTSQFYNSALATIVGVVFAALAFALVPPLTPAVRTRRLLALTLRDLRRLAQGRWLPKRDDWEARAFARLAALPEQAEPLQRARLLAALSVGGEIIHLRHVGRRLGVSAQLDEALDALAHGGSALAVNRLRQIDRDLASRPDRRPPSATLMRARGHLLLMGEALAEHAPYFDAEPTHAVG